MKYELWIIIGVIILGLLVDWYFSARDRRKIFGLRGKGHDLFNAN
jgi:hypothetical protein